MRLALLAALAAGSCLAEKLFVYSELTRIDPFGEVVPQDRGATPRHILSPGLPRNATSSLRVVIQLDKPGKFHLDIAQNPDNAVQPMLYKEVFEKHGNTWIPDKLLPVTIPYNGTETDFTIAGQKVVSFWLDMTVKRSAPVDRVKVEPQLWAPVIDDWVVYPMEVRILEPIIPDVKQARAAVPAVTEPADAAVAGPLRQAICGIKEEVSPIQLTVRHMVRRNAAQQLALVRTPAEIKAVFVKTPNAPPADSFCSGEIPKSDAGPEWYLRVRDNLFRARSRVMP